ncbi:hypothetical protein PYCCODRAFT_1446270 [Trametes coccinea BRFM310]|uniref:Uncharacterized protein n=1 Tax=Trametes coccinea (strain BRFM310) TaxID=1353009 RepID=A0A1Y2IIT0_TRAC3|nr:hypothetical protein PYCCODRAFT_1446270 [Trametes coccinea BRFM310]
MVTRVYNNSLRPFVIIPSFQDISEDKSNGQPKFAVFDIVLGTIYATACAIEVFGVIAAATQRLFLVRVYAVLSLVGSLAVVAAGFMRVVLHFVFKSGLIDECKKIAQGQGIEIRFGIWFHHFKEKLSADDADSFCNSAWSRDSLNEILFLIFEIVFSIFFTLIAFAYYQQVLDPTSAANVSRAPAPAGDGYPDHYNRPYDSDPYAAAPYAPYDAPPTNAPRYAPPPGPPPADVGYGVGMSMEGDKDRKDVKGDAESDMTKFDDPFADFDGPSLSKKHEDGHSSDVL